MLGIGGALGNGSGKSRSTSCVITGQGILEAGPDMANLTHYRPVRPGRDGGLTVGVRPAPWVGSQLSACFLRESCHEVCTVPPGGEVAARTVRERPFWSETAVFRR